MGERWMAPRSTPGTREGHLAGAPVLRRTVAPCRDLRTASPRSRRSARPRPRRPDAWTRSSPRAPGHRAVPLVPHGVPGPLRGVRRPEDRPDWPGADRRRHGELRRRRRRDPRASLCATGPLPVVHGAESPRPGDRQVARGHRRLGRLHSHHGRGSLHRRASRPRGGAARWQAARPTVPARHTFRSARSYGFPRELVGVDPAVLEDPQPVMPVHDRAVRLRLQSVRRTRASDAKRLSVEMALNACNFAGLSDDAEWSGLSGTAAWRRPRSSLAHRFASVPFGFLACS